MFKLILIITLTLSPVDVRVNRFVFDHEFRTSTGCYLAGAYEIASAKAAGFFVGMPPGVTVEIECDDGAT